MSEIALNNYRNFISSKRIVSRNKGIDVPLAAVNPILFPFQRDIVRWACAKGRAAIFANTGLGKTFIQLEWARLMGRNTLIVAPLSVARQTVREASKIGIDVRYVRNQGQVTPEHNIWITNYEMLSHFDASIFGVVMMRAALPAAAQDFCFDSTTKRVTLLSVSSTFSSRMSRP